MLAKPSCDKNRECGQSLPIIPDGRKEGDSWTLRLSFVSPLVFERLVRKGLLYNPLLTLFIQAGSQA